MLQNVIATLKAHLQESTSRGLAHAVSAAINAGELAEGDRLPPIRRVAEGLSLSPTTVSAAWALLARAGTIRTDGRRGTTVAARSRSGPTRYRRALERPGRFATDLSSGVPDPALLPNLSPALHRLRGTSPGSYLDDPVLPGLVAVLREQWPYCAEGFLIADGAMDALDQLCSGHLRFGDRVIVEHPCFPPLLDLLDACGLQPIGVELDDDGPRPDDLATRLVDGVTAVFLQPRAQNPTGASMTPARAEALATVLRDRDVLVVEDDSAGAVASSPAISLGSWLPERTVHIRSFSKSHGPDLRLAAVSGPAAMIDALTERRLLGQGWTSRLLQALLLDLLTHAPAVAAVERARTSYAERRALLVQALADRDIEVGGQDGLNIWLPVRDEAAALVRLASRGIGAAAGSPFEVIRGGRPHLRITSGLVASQHRAIAAELADAATVGAWTSPR